MWRVAGNDVRESHSFDLMLDISQEFVDLDGLIILRTFPQGRISNLKPLDTRYLRGFCHGEIHGESRCWNHIPPQQLHNTSVIYLGLGSVNSRCSGLSFWYAESRIRNIAASAVCQTQWSLRLGR